jgi:hypothetical protein
MSLSSEAASQEEKEKMYRRSSRNRNRATRLKRRPYSAPVPIDRKQAKPVVPSLVKKAKPPASVDMPKLPKSTQQKVLDAFNKCNAAVDEANDIIDKTGERYDEYRFVHNLCKPAVSSMYAAATRFQKLARKAQENAQKV